MSDGASQLSTHRADRAGSIRTLRTLRDTSPVSKIDGLFFLSSPDRASTKSPRRSRLPSSSGDPLRFSLRANPMIRRRHPSNRRSVKRDVVMDALRSHARGERAAHRLEVVQEQGFAWLTRQGMKSGFESRSTDIVVDGYDQHRISRAG